MVLCSPLHNLRSPPQVQRVITIKVCLSNLVYIQSVKKKAMLTCGRDFTDLDLIDAPCPLLLLYSILQGL